LILQVHLDLTNLCLSLLCLRT